jgi:hypothetical protein
MRCTSTTPLRRAGRDGERDEIVNDINEDRLLLLAVGLQGTTTNPPCMITRVQIRRIGGLAGVPSTAVAHDVPPSATKSRSAAVAFMTGVQWCRERSRFRRLRR